MTDAEFIAQLSEHLFWDVDRSAVDAMQHRKFMIPRIMDRGCRSDVRAAWSFYGEDQVREALLDAATLHKKTIAFFAAQFNISRDQFRAYREQSPTWVA